MRNEVTLRILFAPDIKPSMAKLFWGDKNGGCMSSNLPILFYTDEGGMTTQYFTYRSPSIPSILPIESFSYCVGGSTPVISATLQGGGLFYQLILDGVPRTVPLSSGKYQLTVEVDQDTYIATFTVSNSCQTSMGTGTMNLTTVNGVPILTYTLNGVIVYQTDGQMFSLDSSTGVYELTLPKALTVASSSLTVSSGGRVVVTTPSGQVQVGPGGTLQLQSGSYSISLTTYVQFSGTRQFAISFDNSVKAPYVQCPTGQVAPGRTSEVRPCPHYLPVVQAPPPRCRKCKLPHYKWD